MKKRWLGILGSLVLAAGGTFVLVQYVGSADARAMAGQEAVEVLVVTGPVAAGATVEEMAPHVQIEMVPARVAAPDGVKTLRDLVGMVTAVDLVPGEQVLSTRFTTPAELEEQRAVTVPEGMVEITVALDPERAVGGELAEGDLVTVFASFEPFDLETTTLTATRTPDGTAEEADEEAAEAAPAELPKRTPNSTALILHNTLITNVQTTRLPTPPALAGTEDGEETPAAAPDGEVLVTLAVEPPHAERLIFTAEYGGVWLGHESGEVTDSGSRLQTRLSVYDPLEAAR